ncbi:predicted protein [Plenodomus lingam JN3]|uniref:Predicted protein n=1 Tax=Leptosphaeria maculans (strain JN3 / isolate v23.1.3 / race Av1-4-5-6-7-8) TaxID=985895 RepID=E4ZJX1_LEPMJ|nr:predicted protein [Plenodomus lingam JN3]CBX91406.1 predicted protein [Plenodomus lingam JN3]
MATREERRVLPINAGESSVAIIDVQLSFSFQDLPIPKFAHFDLDEIYPGIVR